MYAVKIGYLHRPDDIPDGPNNPSADQPLMKENTNHIDQLIAVDHVSFNFNDGGYHTVIHQELQTVVPPTIAGIGQIYSKNVTVTNSAGSSTFDQLFHKNGGGGISQLSGSHSATNGYTNVAGLIIQWGTIAVGAAGTPGGTPVTFNTSPNFNFPNTCFNVVLTMINNQGDAPSANSLFVKSGSVSNTGFSIVNTSGSGSQSAYWIALGN